MLRVSAGLWFIHAASVVACGVLLSQIGEQIASVEWVTYAFLLAIATASGGAASLGFGIWTLARGSIDFVPPTSGQNEEDPRQLAIPRTAYRHGRKAALMCLVYAGIGILAIVALLVSAPGSFSAISLSYLWLLASGILLVVGLLGGDFLEKFLVLLEIYEDPFHLLRWYAALTAGFSNWFLIAVGLLSSGLLGALFFALPFGLCPLIGFLAFSKLYQLGSRISVGRLPVPR